MYHFNFLQECHCDFGTLCLAEGILPAVLIPKALTVIGNGIGNGVSGHQISHPSCLFNGLFLRNCCGKEVSAQQNVLFPGLLKIVTGIGILHDYAIQLPSVPKTNHGKGYAGVGNLLPVNSPLIFGNINTQHHFFNFIGIFLFTEGTAGAEQCRRQYKSTESVKKTIIHNHGVHFSFSVSFLAFASGMCSAEERQAAKPRPPLPPEGHR